MPPGCAEITRPGTIVTPGLDCRLAPGPSPIIIRVAHRASLSIPWVSPANTSTNLNFQKGGIKCCVTTIDVTC